MNLPRNIPQEAIFSTYLGGTEQEGGTGIAIDPAGNIALSGWTISADFPLVNPTQPDYGGGADGFVLKLNKTGSTLVFSTFLGGIGTEEPSGIACDHAGNVYVSANADPSPLSDPFGFVSMFDPAGKSLFSTHFGLWISGVAVDDSGDAYISGNADTSPPGAAFGWTTEGFVAKIHYVNTQAGEGISLQLGGIATLMFSNVSDDGYTTIAPSDDPPQIPGGFSLGDPPSFYDIRTTATFTGPVAVCLGYDPGQYNDLNNVRLLHYENGAWADVTTSNDTLGNVVCGEVNSLSPFAIAELVDAAPVVAPIVAPLEPTKVNTAINVSSEFSDPVDDEIHSAVWQWGDGTVTAGTVIESNGIGSVTGTHSYASAGVYTITLAVTDEAGQTGVSIFQFIVVYDLEAGFVTGGGWINSPAGAYVVDTTVAGRANFGFVSKYQKGANLPTGMTEFQFKVASLNFRSTSYEWLVVAGARAQYKGSGTINGTGNYGFMLTAIDGQINGGGGADKFRIRIWDKNIGDSIVYDNQMSAGDTADPTTVIGGGSIVIHK